MDKILLRGWPQLTSRSISLRSLHVTQPIAKYRINYDQLKDGTLTNLASADKDLLKKRHSELIENVKNVQGYNRGAERGFTAIYPDCIHVLTNSVSVPELATWFRKVLTHNLSLKTLNQRYGILVPITYKQLHPNASKEEMNQAHILGWCVELVRAASIVTTETIARETSVRYGRTSSQKEKSSWVDRHNLGNMAFNDALMIERGVFVLLKHYFQDSASVFHDAILKAQNSRVNGRALGYSLLDDVITDNRFKKNRLSEFNLANYKLLAKTHVSDTNYCLPISLAMHLAGKHDEKQHELAHKILHEMGYYGEVTRDFINCFVDKDGTDIQDGRLTSLIVIALQRANSVQKEQLKENYGLQDENNAKIVKQVYEELKLKKTMIKHIDEKKSDIYSAIQGIAKLDKAGLTTEFFLQLLENMDIHNIS